MHARIKKRKIQNKSNAWITDQILLEKRRVVAIEMIRGWGEISIIIPALYVKIRERRCEI